MAMNQFEDQLEKFVRNPERLLNEVLQLENYIFRSPPISELQIKKPFDSPQPINDL